MKFFIFHKIKTGFNVYEYHTFFLLFFQQFSPEQPVRPETAGYVKKPSLRDKIHCVVFVVDASKITFYPQGLNTAFQQLREHISDLGEHRTDTDFTTLVAFVGLSTNFSDYDV